MARPKLYPTFYCSHCQLPLKRHKDIYHDCHECNRHYKVVDGDVVEIPKRAYRVREKVVSDGVGKYLDADEFEALAG